MRLQKVVGFKTKDVKSFDGVVFDNDTGVVTKLDLLGACLSGTLRANSSLFRVPPPQNIWISETTISLGNCPTYSTQEAHSLRILDVSHNQIAGKLPMSLTNCTNLKVINVESNRIVDLFPFWLKDLPNLKVVVLRSNMFHGPIYSHQHPLSFPQLRMVDISRNKFTGRLPHDYFVTWSTPMIDSRIYYNDFTGHIPSSWANLTRLESLDLSGNQLSGKIPHELASLSFLEYINDWNTSNTEKKTVHFSILAVFKSLFSRERIMFGLISGGVFLACNAVSFYFYGHEFLHEALLYHLTRTDPRHNFSIYFYHIYLHYERPFSAVEKLISFLPQFTVQLALVFCFSQDLVFCMFLQTVAFVAFNKVITAQYFVWFYCLLPLILPWSRMKLKWEGLLCIILWIGAQTHWLLWGYMLEFKGVNVFLQLWMASLVFLAANTFVLVKIIQRHRFSPLFRQYGSSNRKNVKKLD
ncbi:hypothetical protein F2Q70_00014613 [Brassica cretica]|uniref:GPI mannosyltransferase 1 n=1 Tax=Brassica cretica TaxID=69181 RepID=A0A8S9HRR4_BRACR|nr:hypothetical protein F2Q70_00014613 [Brassica cretica]